MNVAVMGYGTVGSGVVEIINTKHSYINERTSDEDLEVKYILDLRDFPGDPNEGKFTKDFNDILNDDSVKIVAEAMGGVNPAFDFTAKCLAAGKHVVTSNKELVSTRGSELLKIAKENNVNYLFEASVGGGIPLIRPLVFCLAGNEIQSINGILNGTTNFILTKMIYENLTFEEALKIAQDNGYAEKDPTADRGHHPHHSRRRRVRGQLRMRHQAHLHHGETGRRPLLHRGQPRHRLQGEPARRHRRRVQRSARLR